MNKQEQIEDLKKYYKRIVKCRICGVIYGSDLENENYICPRCEKKLKRGELRLSKEQQEDPYIIKYLNKIKSKKSRKCKK